MNTYPVDIDPEQIVRWLVAEQETAPSAFRIRAWRSSEVRALPMRQEFHLGDQEREDLSEVATIATLEIAPTHAAEGWRVTVQIEDEIGPQEPDQETAVGNERQIDLGAFYSRFIRPGRGTASVVAETQDDAAEARMERLLEAIESNRHKSERGGKKTR